MKNSTRWLPAVIAPVLIAAGAIAIPVVANAASTPPTKTAQQVLAMIAGSRDAAYSGTVEQTSDLGLPQVPSVGPGSASPGSDPTSQLLDLLTANHTARVFVDGPTKQRLQVLDSLAERDVVRNGDSVWTYDSKTDTATHVDLSQAAHRAPGQHFASPGATPQTDPGATAGATPGPTPGPDAQALTPSALADKFLAAIGPSTTVTVSSTSSVAGRPVYQLELTPKTDGTLISSVTLSIDAATGLPLKVVVDARGQKADAFTVGFRSIDFSAPAATLFTFTPPKGATVTTPKADAPTPPPGDHPTTSMKPTVTGTGWASIVEVPAGATGAAGAAGLGSSASPSQSKLLGELTIPVPGGRVLQTSLLSVLMTDDGRILICAVPITSLEAAAR